MFYHIYLNKDQESAKKHVTNWNVIHGHGISFPSRELTFTEGKPGHKTICGSRSFVCACNCTVRNSVFDPKLKEQCPFFVKFTFSKVTGCYAVKYDESFFSHSTFCGAKASYDAKTVRRVVSKEDLHTIGEFSSAAQFEGFMKLKGLHPSEHASDETLRK